jgi:glycosyltransferase involved in cell wall biosynthesis
VAHYVGVNVSVVIPARNAAATIRETLESLQRQTHKTWEAVVVDNGSTDETATIVSEFCRRDARFRLIACETPGVSVARNRGIDAARNEWLMFLDADDTLAANAMSVLTGLLSERTDLDAAYGGWARLAPNGETYEEWHPSEASDLFADFAITCAFAIHTCVVRRRLVVEQGGFDERLITCEDWDLWQRIARAGARFGRVLGVLAYYRMRPASASNQAVRLMSDASRTRSPNTSLGSIQRASTGRS